MAMAKKKYHLQEQEIPEGFQIFEDGPKGQKEKYRKA
jgi:hypothetical protein